VKPAERFPAPDDPAASDSFNSPAASGATPAASDSHASPNAVLDFDRLVYEHLDFVWRLLRRFGLSPSDADDAAQQVFMVAARKLDELPAGTERTFLYGTARRVAANARRARRRRNEVGAELLEELGSKATAPDELVELGRAAALLDELLEALPEKLRRVLVLAELEDASVPAIAELEGLPSGTAASRLRRARVAFASVLRRAVRRNPFGEGEP
jgi:RNA polymerase sigma-70 factor (ECF subfamily)